MNLTMLLASFTETSKNFRELDSKHGELKEIYELLSYFKNHKPTNNKIKNRKDRILNVSQLYNKYFDTYKKNTKVKI